MSYPAGRTLTELEHNLVAVQRRIAAACRRVHRDPHEVRLLPVSKTVDEARLRLAEALDRRLQIEGRTLDVLVQVNTSNEPSKFGLEPDADAGQEARG